MRIALGVQVSTHDVIASLVDTELPELGPLASRTVAVASTPGGIGGAVATALGFMRVQALQNHLVVVGAAVVCENAVQRGIVADALGASEIEPTPVVDIFDERLTDAFTPDVAVALLVGVTELPAVSAAPRMDHRGIWPVAAVGACVLAALGGVTAWAMTAETLPGSEVTAGVEVVDQATPVGADASAVPVSPLAPQPGPPPPAPEVGPEVLPAAPEFSVIPPGTYEPAPSQFSPSAAPERPADSSQPTRTVTPPADGGNGGSGNSGGGNSGGGNDGGGADGGGNDGGGGEDDGGGADSGGGEDDGAGENDGGGNSGGENGGGGEDDGAGDGETTPEDPSTPVTTAPTQRSVGPSIPTLPNGTSE